MRIAQVVRHLLANAVKFGPGKPVEVALEAQADSAVLQVKDHGIGIAPERVESLFQRFERAVPVRHYGGLGLGLYRVRRIVEAHGGEVTVDSVPGQGATFRVHLPRAGASQPELPARAGVKPGLPGCLSRTASAGKRTAWCEPWARHYISVPRAATDCRPLGDARAD